MRTCLAALAAAVALVCPAAALADDSAAELGSGTAVTCATTATLADDTSVANSGGRYVQVCNPSDATSTVYVGNASVTTSNGIPVAAGKCWSSGVRLKDTAKVYCIVASGTQAVRAQEAR